MKLNHNCEEYKFSDKKSGLKTPCKCAYLNRKFIKNLKIWNKTLENSKKV